MKQVLLGLVAAVLFFVALVMAASELGGEVVRLRTTGTDGSQRETSLWIVEDEGALWLRAGQPGAAWLQQIREQPKVRLERAGATQPYRAVVVPGRHEHINSLMAEKYGWAEQVIGVIHDDTAVMAIRLDPREP